MRRDLDRLSRHSVFIVTFSVNLSRGILELDTIKLEFGFMNVEI